MEMVLLGGRNKFQLRRVRRYMKTFFGNLDSWNFWAVSRAVGVVGNHSLEVGTLIPESYS